MDWSRRQGSYAKPFNSSEPIDLAFTRASVYKHRSLDLAILSLRTLMPYSTLKKITDSNGIDRHDYVVEGTFSNMMYLCVDVHRNRLEGSKLIEKSPEEVAKEYRAQLTAFFNSLGPIFDEKYVHDYSLVFTPNICDSKSLGLKFPHETGNFIATPFNYEEIDLVEKVLIPSESAGGNLDVPTERRKRLGTTSRLDVYIALEINDEHTDFSSWEKFGRESNEYAIAMRNASMNLATWTTDYTKESIRTFLPYTHRIKYGKREPYFVEQYFCSAVKRETRGWPLGDGYIKKILNGAKGYNLVKYAASDNLFDSTGWEFCSYGLSKQEIAIYRNQFKKNPIVEIQYKS